MIKNARLIIFSFLLMTCASKEVGQKQVSDLLFPFGRYSQEVILTFWVDNRTIKKEKSFELNSILSQTKEELRLVGFNDFGFTLFTIVQKGLGEPQADSSIDEINSHREMFLKIFSMVQSLLKIKKLDPRLNGNKMTMDVGDMKCDIELSEYDSSGVPMRQIVSSKGNFRVEVKTTSYYLF